MWHFSHFIKVVEKCTSLHLNYGLIEQCLFLITLVSKMTHIWFHHFTFCRCIFNIKTLSGRIMSNVSAVILLFVFVTCIVVYTFLWIRKKHTSTDIQLQSVTQSKKSKYMRTGQVMMVFVVAFLMQWWPWATQAVMSYVLSQLPLGIIFAVVSLCNMGGTFNAIVYTVTRKRFLQRS